MRRGLCVGMGIPRKGTLFKHQRVKHGVGHVGKVSIDGGGLEVELNADDW